MVGRGEFAGPLKMQDNQPHNKTRMTSHTNVQPSATQAVIRQSSFHPHKAPSNQSLEGSCGQSGGFTYDDETQHRSLQDEFAMAKALPRAERVPAVIYVIVDQQTIACIVLHIVDEFIPSPSVQCSARALTKALRPISQH